jgi:hypothetical protein
VTTETPPAPENDHSGPTWRPVQWHPNAIQRAVDHATTVVNDIGIPADDLPIHGTALTWMDIACLLDVARQAERDQAELDKLRAQLTALDDGQTEHEIDVNDGGWFIKHTLNCRPHLFDCPVHHAAERHAFLTFPPPGRYLLTLDPDGWIVIGDLVHTSGQVPSA